ncbi:MAG: hypothetical protein KKH98_15940 [Spirochaetes bacterium]|nr:hypothetical protein [Spirochaetota bacterium]
MHKDLKDFKWQRSYYEHVIRNEKELLNIRKYINNNPLKWNLDIENSNNQKKKVDLDKYYRKIYQGEF